MDCYSKYFLQSALWLDDGFCTYYVQDTFWGRQDILDVESVIFMWEEDAEAWLNQCVDHDPGGTFDQLRYFLAHDASQYYHVHRMNDRQVLSTAARELIHQVLPVVIKPHLGLAVLVDEDLAEPVRPIAVEPAPDIGGLFAALRHELDSLVAEQQKRYDAHETRLAAMNTVEKAAFYAESGGGAFVESAVGGTWDLVKALPGFYPDYLKALWKAVSTPARLAAATTRSIATGELNPLQNEIDAFVNPIARTWEQSIRFKSTLTVLLSNPDTHQLLYDFSHRYWDATHPVERSKMAAGAASDILVTILLAIFTAGVGAAANMAAKSTRLIKVGRLLERIALTLKKINPPDRLLGKVRNTAENLGVGRKASSKAKKGIPGVKNPQAADKLDDSAKKRYGDDGKRDGPKKTRPVAPKKFKRKHLDGDPKDPYTLMPDGKPMGAEVGKVPSHLKGLDGLPANHDKYVKDGWPSLNAEYRKGQFAEDFRNFTDANPDTLKPGTKIYRIIDDQSGEFTKGVSGSYWTTEMPRNKTAWRKDYAVKDSWNDDGYVIEETVGPDGLKIWRGETAAQRYEDSDFFLKGGKEQIFIQRGAIGNTQPKLTNWPDL